MLLTLVLAAEARFALAGGDFEVVSVMEQETSELQEAYRWQHRLRQSASL
jgi:hypothetical protein